MCIRDRYNAIDNKAVVSMETHWFPFLITHQRSAANVRHVLINIFNVKTYTHKEILTQTVLSPSSAAKICNEDTYTQSPIPTGRGTQKTRTEHLEGHAIL